MSAEAGSALKYTLMVYGIIGLTYGLVFLLVPGAYISFSGAEPVALGWLRWPGGMLAGFGLGTILLSRNPARQMLFVTTAALVATLIGLSLVYTMIAGEYTMKIRSLIIPAAMNVVAAALLWWGRAQNREALSD